MQRKFKAIPAMILSCTLVFSQVAMAEGNVVMQATVTTEVKAAPEQDQTKIKISQEEAKKIVSAIDFTKGYTIVNANLETNNGQIAAVWRFDLSTSATALNPSCTLTISAETGEIVNFYSWQTGMNKKNIVNLTKKEAKKIADKMIESILKTGHDNLEVLSYPEYYYERTNGIYESHYYDFNYIKKVNGILASDEVYSISIDASNGKLTRYNAQYPYILHEYPTVDGVQDTAKLKEVYESSLKMQLQYQIMYDNNNQKAFLAYLPGTPNQLDAKTMKPVEDDLGSITNVTPTTDYISMVPGAKVEKKEITEEEGIKRIENAKLYLEKQLNFTFEESQGASYIGGVDAPLSRNYRALINNKEYSISTAVDLKTGNINYFSLYNYSYNGQKDDNPSSTAKISYKDAKKKSDDLIKNLFPKQYGVFCDINIEPVKSNDLQSNFYTLQYMRVENGIPAGNTISVTIDKQTGKIEQLNMSWYDMDFPSLDNIISADQAKKTYLDGIEYKLKYYTPYTYSSTGIEKIGKTCIVFGPDVSYAYRPIDAKTGKFVDWTGQELQTSKIDENHWAASSIEMLTVQGSLSGKLPGVDEELTRQDAVKMLSLTMGLQSMEPVDPAKSSFADVDTENAYYKYIENAVQLGIISATDSYFNGKQRIDKKEYIRMLVNMLGYNEIVDKLFPNQTEDSNYTICKALDILPVKPGEVYNQYDKITFAEAAYALQKALKYIR